jgi:hypothetical protein
LRAISPTCLETSVWQIMIGRSVEGGTAALPPLVGFVHCHRHA